MKCSTSWATEAAASPQAGCVRVLGIDPGSRRTGWGVVEERSGQLRLIDCGTITAINRERVGFSERLACIYHELCGVIGRHQPHEAGIEQVFVARNAASALKLGQARGVAVAACAAAGIPVHDYEPTLIKKSLVGIGRADKEQVRFMVARLLGVRSGGEAPERRWGLDTSDALGVAICHLTMRRFALLARR